jgi:hypothetical protein
VNNLAITVGKESQGCFTKANPSYPIRFGKYCEIRTADHEFHFNPKGEIKFIRGLNPSWPHPCEWLKRSDGNDWTFYSVGSVVNGAKPIVDWLGEYYLPCLTYPSNSICTFNPYSDPAMAKALGAWSQLYATLFEVKRHGLAPQINQFIDLVLENDETALFKGAETLHSIIGGRVSVLPPDTRHVDYEVIPINIADGCLYHCDFCCVKSDQAYQRRSRKNIRGQIQRLKAFYGDSLGGYHSLFLGNHDALGAGEELISMAASEAFKAFGFKNCPGKRPMLFLFGSVGSLARAENGLLDRLDNLPFHTYINLGLESVDPSTLAAIGKPLKSAEVCDAFWKMVEINRKYANIEITANFLLGEGLSHDHHESLGELLHSVPDHSGSKGGIYLSPLMEDSKKDPVLRSFFEIKEKSRLPAYVYLVQRL